MPMYIPMYVYKDKHVYIYMYIPAYIYKHKNVKNTIYSIYKKVYSPFFCLAMFLNLQSIWIDAHIGMKHKIYRTYRRLFVSTARMGVYIYIYCCESQNKWEELNVFVRF